MVNVFNWREKKGVSYKIERDINVYNWREKKGVSFKIERDRKMDILIGVIKSD